MEQYWRGNMFVLISAVAFGLMPIFARFAYENHVSVQALLLVRFILAFPTMGVFLFLAGRHVVPRRNQLLVLLILGSVIYFLQSSLYFTALVYIPVSVVALILYTYPPFVTAGSLILGWEKRSALLMVCISLALVGLFLVANPRGHIVFLGVLMALGASITYTVYFLVSSRVLRDLDGKVASFYVMGAASLSFLLSNSLGGGIRISWNLQGWTWVILISVICTSFAVTTLFQGVKLIGPSQAAVLSIMEPASSLIGASVLFGESLNIYQAIGAIFIILAAIMTALRRSISEKSDRCFERILNYLGQLRGYLPLEK